jgi:drug/metabolite transporter (DMT)-like permease
MLSLILIAVILIGTFVGWGCILRAMALHQADKAPMTVKPSQLRKQRSR